MAAKAPEKAPEAAAEEKQERESIVLGQLVDPIRAMADVGPVSFGAASLIKFADLMQTVQMQLLARDPKAETLADQDRILLTYLSAYFHGICATPHIIHGDMLERVMVASGMVMPFAGPSETGGAARFGVPTNVTPDVICDSASEILRMATAAVLALYVYLNFQRKDGQLPSDEATMTFTTIAANSAASEANVAKVDAELEALGAPGGGVRCAQIKWLMHFVRQLVMTQMGAVCHILGHKRKHAECVVAAQHDHKLMVKAMPDIALGYSMWGRSAMALQQMGVAAAVLSRGLAVAQESRDDSWEASLAYQLAIAKILGGSSPAAGGGAKAGAEEGPDAGAAAEGKEVEGKEAEAGVAEGEAAAPAAEVQEFDAAEVLALQEQGAAAAAHAAEWWPPAWSGQAPRGEPDRTVLAEKLIPMVEERAGGGRKVADGGKFPVLTGVLYVTRAPSSVPPGALDSVGEGGEGGAIPEGEEEEGGAGGGEARAQVE